MAATQEDSFREIQLSGKALVFVFMAGTVILVGVFLMGLLVGRGVLATKGAPGVDTVAASEAEPPLPPRRDQRSSSSPVDRGRKTQLRRAARIGRARERAAQGRKRVRASRDTPTPKAESLAPAPPAPPAAPPAAPRRATGAGRGCARID